LEQYSEHDGNHRRADQRQYLRQRRGDAGDRECDCDPGPEAEHLERR
jgi:hypothetical protein